MSATVTGTVLTVVGWRKRPPAANATTTSAAAATAATNANFSGRLVGPSIGSRKPKAVCDFRSLITCSKARPTSIRASGTASSVAIERASSDTTSKRPWHSVQPSRWAASAPERASGSSTIRRRVPSVRCATGDLLAQCGFCAPQHSSDLSDSDAERLRDLGVAQPACAHCERGGGPRSQPAKRLSHLAAIFTDLELLLGVERVVAFLQRLRRLALLPASGPSQAVEGGMGGGPMQPRRRVFGCEKGLERLVFRPDGGHPARTEVHAHYPSSTARCRFVTALAPEMESIRPAQAGHQPARALRRRELRAISSSTIAKSVLGRAWIWPWKASVQCSGGHLRT